ncbi:LAMI_0E13718g1_1 [Lachancea mirantina]|uniref:LAMI_0E13718g1_1 n=1 Tax=Lachancea mirantina TaxID=1230905 RepID=A0A1G4JRF5_9SACH|nr:LAMI_0E13718g1_1 [Lachancea mirantina]
MAKDQQNDEDRISDPRFAKVQNDPKFRDTKAKKFKIKVDDRFSKKDLEVKRKAKVDKYGRKIDKVDNSESRDFDRFFERDDSENADVKLSDDNSGDEAKISPLSVDRARGDVPSDYVSSSDEAFTSSDSEEDSEDSEAESDEELGVEPENARPASGDSSKTLAVVNLDWDHVQAADLMVTFSSFVPQGGNITKIAVYPSEFGKERMAREEKEGPPREVFASKKKSSKRGNDDAHDNGDVNVSLKDLYEEGDAEADFDGKSLRRYQLERLRYYYAVVYCSDVKTAEAIYKNCDGTEYESTANLFDLRYVPDGMDFTDKPRDECDQRPSNYKPSQFSTDALQHSKVKLTWDETPAQRLEMSKRAFSQKELEDMDFKAYLASDSEESENEKENNIREKLKGLVQQSTQIGDRNLFEDRKDDGASDVDMEVTFAPGLSEAKVTEEGRDKEEESTIQKIKRKEKERRKKRKDRVKELKKQAEEEKKTKSKASKKIDSVRDAKSRAELELLMMEDDENQGSAINSKAHFNMNEILKSEKEKKKKSKYQNKNKIVEDEFKPDLKDERFAEMFEDRDFAIDPSQPEFKDTAAMKKILEERTKRASAKRHKRKNGSFEKRTKSNDGVKVNDLVERIKKSSKKRKTQKS